MALEEFLRVRAKFVRIKRGSELEEKIHIMKYTDLEEFIMQLNTNMFVSVHLLYCSGVEVLIDFDDLKHCVPTPTLEIIRKFFDEVEIKKINRN